MNVDMNQVVDPGYTSRDKVESGRVGVDERSSLFGDGEPVDLETTSQLLEQLEAMGSFGESDWAQLGEALERKHTVFSEVLRRPVQLGEEGSRVILRSVFATRRHAEELLETVGPEALGEIIDDLLHGDGDISERFDAFCGKLDCLDPGERFSLASELLHFTDPENHHPWTRWMWNPESQTGALPLVTSGVDLDGETPGETYLKAGAAFRAVDDRREELPRGLATGPFGTVLLLAAIHCAYTYLTTAMRMTRGFTDFVPEPPEYVGRVLGVHPGEVLRG